jgi:protoheme IX farnesyltransferase
MKLSIDGMSSRTRVGNDRGLRYWVLSAAIATFVLIVFGYVVRVSGAGTACPDWPTCYGQWGVPGGLSAQIQYAHRALAAIAAALILISTILAFLTVAPGHVRSWLVLALGLTVLEAGLGAGGVYLKDPALLDTLHLGLALGVQSLMLLATVTALSVRLPGALSARMAFRTRFARLALFSTLAVMLVMLSGVFLTSAAPQAACAGWPLCNGSLIPGQPLAWLELGHRALTALASLAVAALLISAWRRVRENRVTLTAATGVAVLFFGEVLIGALKVMKGSPLDLVGLHAVTTAGLWALLTVLVAAVGLDPRSAAEEDQAAREPIETRGRLKDLFTLTKPVIVLLLLVTTYAGMVVGGRQVPSLALTFWTMVGGALAAGGASAINQYIDRDLDRNMQRTARRPLAARRMTPAEGLAFGLALCLLAFFLLAGFVNLLAALLSFAGMIYYVLIYSIFLKRATVQNIVIGGGAGAIPPLVGWAAATGGLSVPSLFLFAIVFLWTPPHFWALALIRRKDYARAGVPMLPVIKGEQATRKQILIYTLELVALTLLMPALHLAGSVYLVGALGLGGGLIFAAWRVLRSDGNKTAYQLYRYSSMYLALLFLALALDVFIKL